jgi:hypothetical protein
LRHCLHAFGVKYAFDIKVVLYTDGDTVERQSVSTFGVGVDGGSLSQRRLRSQFNDGVDNAIDRRDPVEMGLYQFPPAYLA